MNSRDAYRSTDELSALICHSLRRGVANKLPAPEVRRQILQRAAGRQRRSQWRWLVSGVLSLREWLYLPWPASGLVVSNNLLYVQVLFRTQANWFGFSQLLR